MTEPGRATLPTRAERHDAGVALRARVHRSAHATWAPSPGRPDPLAILRAQDASRIAELVPVRYERMRASPLAFLRGSAAVMAADLAATPTTALRVQACGDAHLANFGAYASPEGHPVFDINDFDETLPAPFEWDVKRLATSLVLAAGEAGWTPRAAADLVENAIRAYADGIGRLARVAPLAAWSTAIDLAAAIDAIDDNRVRRRARRRLDARLRSAAEHFGLIDTGTGPLRLREKPPLVRRLPDHDALAHDAFDRYVATLAPERKLLLARYTLRDVVFKVVGIGSVGTFCAIGLYATADDEPLLLQIKQAQRSVLEPFAGASVFSTHGERVVTGQRMTQAASDMFLNWTEAGAGAATKHFYVRRLKDGRLADIGATIEADGLADYAVLCGRTLARAHARSGDVVTMAGYLGRGGAFARAVAAFALAYAKQTEWDWEKLVAVR